MTDPNGHHDDTYGTAGERALKALKGTTRAEDCYILGALAVRVPEAVLEAVEAAHAHTARETDR